MIAAALLASLAVAVSGEVVLRGGGSVIDLPITAVSEQGVEVEQAGGDPRRLIGWDQVREVRGERAGEAAEWMGVAEKAWRARTRLARGDMALASPVFEELFGRYRGTVGPTALMVSEGTLVCRVGRGERVEAVEAWLSVVRNRRAGIKLEDGSKVESLVDERTGLVSALSPLFMTGAKEQEIAERVTTPWGEELTDELARLYAAMAKGESPGELRGEASEGVVLAREIVAAVRGEGSERATARERLSERAGKARGEWVEAWCRGAVGMSLTQESDAASRMRGVLELLRVTAGFGGRSDGLAGWCAERAADELTKSGDVATAARLRGEEGTSGKTLEEFLASRGLNGLLAAHLKDGMRNVPSGNGAGPARRLAMLYAKLIEEEPAAERREAWEKEARALLAESPEADTIELRLSLARAAFIGTEAVVDRLRLRQVAKESTEAGAALASLETLAKEFDSVAGRANRAVTDLEKQEESRRNDEQEFAAAQTSAKRIRSLARYFAGWCLLLRAECVPSDRQGAATEALKQFGWLLNSAPGVAPKPEEASGETMKFAHVARSAMGAALCEALRGNLDRAMAWLDAVEHSDVAPDEVLATLFLRRLHVMGVAGRWGLVNNWIHQQRNPELKDVARSRRLVAGEARLLIVLAMEPSASAPTEAGEARLVALRALTDLLVQEEWGHVLELARLYPALTSDHEALAEAVHGIESLDKARAVKHDSPELAVARFADASVAIEAVLKLMESDGTMRDARGPLMFLLASCRFESARGDTGPEQLDAASAEFEGASAEFSERVQRRGGIEDGRAADAMWMAIRAAEAGRRMRGEDETSERETALLTMFTERYPSDERSAIAAVRAAAAITEPREEIIRRLLDVPETNSIYLSARREAARLLDEAVRRAPEGERAWNARRFAAVAEPLIAMEAQAAAAGDVDAARRACDLARRVAGALLSGPTPDVERVRRAMGLVTSFVESGMVNDPTIRDELMYREAQLAMARGELPKAEQLVTAIETSSGDDGKWSRAGITLLFREAAKRRARVAAGAPDQERIAAARPVVEIGRRLLKAREGENESSDDVAVRIELASAAAELWRLAKDEKARDLAVVLYRVLLRDHPNDASMLRGAAELDESVGQWAGAATKWGVIVSGSRLGTEPWFEAKFRLIDATSRVDAGRASELLAQHRVMYPGGGPEPWGKKFDELERRVNGGAGAARGPSRAGSGAR